MSKISVVIPIYNVEAFLEKCLNSVVDQSFKDLEIILVEDKSTDSSLQICQKFAAQDSRIKLICNTVNKGLGAARNIGIKQAMGEYISFIDSDDWIAPNYFEALYHTAIANDSSVVLTKVIHVFKDRQETVTIDEKMQSLQQLTYENCMRLLRKGISHGVHGRLMKRALLTDHYFTFRERSEDFEFFAEDVPFPYYLAYFSKKINFCSETAYFYNKMNEDSITALFQKGSKKYQRGIKDLATVVSDVFSLMRDKKLFFKEYKAFIKSLEIHFKWHTTLFPFYNNFLKVEKKSLWKKRKYIQFLWLVQYKWRKKRKMEKVS